MNSIGLKISSWRWDQFFIPPRKATDEWTEVQYDFLKKKLDEI